MSEVIELTMPVDPDLLMVVRFTAAAVAARAEFDLEEVCLLYTSPSPRDRQKSRMPSSA